MRAFSLLGAFALVLSNLALTNPACAGTREGSGPDTLARKGEVRARILRQMEANPTIGPGGNDRAEDLVDELRLRSLAAMDAQGLKKAELERRPWSDYYWPIYAGVTAHRYADPRYNAAMRWELNERYLIQNLGRGPVAQLSPAEKYDLLVGDGNFSLSRQNINEGKTYFDNGGKVETWMGICHGWAPASFMENRPLRSVKAIAADGQTEIEFYPADLRALASLLWANGQYGMRFIGGRCNEREPAEDDDGRVTEPACLDTNPATWHLAVVNQIGVSKRSFILDTNYDYEVWNQPVVGYFYGYVDARTENAVERLEDAIVPIDEKDPRRAHRAAGATHYVRVAMNVTYGLERTPGTQLVDSAEQDVSGNALYEYELELNAAGEIVGGEWMHSTHPDFLWVPEPDARVRSAGDRYLDRQRDQNVWAEPGAALPAAWRRPAAESARLGQPLARVVEQLIRWSQ